MSSQSDWGSRNSCTLAPGVKWASTFTASVCKSAPSISRLAPALGNPLRDDVGLLAGSAWRREVVVGVDRMQGLVGAGQRIVDAPGVRRVDAGVLFGVDHQGGAADSGQVRFRAGLRGAQTPHAQPAAQRACRGDAVCRAVGLDRYPDVAGVGWPLRWLEGGIDHPR